MRWSELTWYEQILIVAARRAMSGGDYVPPAKWRAAYAFLRAHGPEYEDQRRHEQRSSN